MKGTTRKISSQEGRFLNFVRPLMTGGLPLIKNVLTPEAKSVLVQLGLTAAAAATDAAIHKKIFESCTTALIISNDKMDAIMQIVKSLEDAGLLIKSVTESIKNEAKEQRGGFCNMLLDTLGASLLAKILAGEGFIQPGERVIATSWGCRTNKAGQGF